MMMRMCVVIVMNVVAAIIAAIIATIIAAIIAAIYNFFKTGCNVVSDTRSLCQPNSGHPSLRSSAVAAITEVLGCCSHNRGVSHAARRDSWAVLGWGNH